MYLPNACEPSILYYAIDNHNCVHNKKNLCNLIVLLRVSGICIDFESKTHLRLRKQRDHCVQEFKVPHCGLNLKGTRAFRVFPYYFLYVCACTAIPGVCGYRIQQPGAHVKNLIAMGRGTILGELPWFSAFHCRIKGQTSKNPIEKVWDPLAKTTWPN